MKTVQARLDDKTAVELARLTKHLGLTESQVVRRALSMLATVHPVSGKRKFVGLGEFDSGISDLATNKAHMEGFGR